MNQAKSNLIVNIFFIFLLLQTRLTRTTKQLNAFRLSASHDAKRNQATISSLQSKIAQQPESVSPTLSAVSDRSLSPSPNGVRLDGEGGDAGREREAELLAQLQNAQQELTSLRVQVAKRKEEEVEYSGNVERMRSELETLGVQLGQKQAEMDAIREHLSSELEDLRRQITQRDLIEAKLARELEDLKALRPEGENGSAALGNHERDDSNYEEEIGVLRINAKNMREQLQLSQDKIVKEAYLNSELIKELEMERENLEKERNTNVALTNELVQERAKAKDTDVDALRAHLRETESHVSSLRTQLRQALDDLESEKQANAELVEELNRETARRTEASQSEVDALRSQLRESESRNASLREQLRETLDNLEHEKHANSELVSELASQGTEPSADNDRAKQEEIESLRAQVRDAERDMQDQAKVAREHMQQLVHAKEQLADNQRKFGHTQAELDSLRTQFLNVKEKLEKTIITNAELEDQLHTKDRRSEEGEDQEALIAQLQQTREDLEKAIDANNELERQLQETLDELEEAKRSNSVQEDPSLRQLVRELEKQVEEDKAKIRRKDSELEDLRAQLQESEAHATALRTQNQHAREQGEKLSNANLELERQCNQRQVELNTQRAQMLANERQMDSLRVELLQAHDAVEKLKHAKMELEREMEEERMKLPDERHEELEVLRTQLQQAHETLDSEMQTNLEQRQTEHDKLKKAWEELDRREKTNVDLERQLALLRAEEGVWRAQLQQQKGDLDSLRLELREVKMEREVEEQERARLASMIEALQQANEGLAVRLHKRDAARESPKPNGKSEPGGTPKKSPKKEPKHTQQGEEGEDGPEELEEGEIVEDEEEDIIEDEEDEDDEDDDNEAMVEALQEEIKQEQKRTTNLVQAIYTLQIELQQERNKQGEMDRTLGELQRGNDRLTQEVYDLRNASSDSIAREVTEEEKGENGEWEGLEKELSKAVGLRAVALRTIIQGNFLLLFSFFSFPSSPPLLSPSPSLPRFLFSHPQ